MNETVATADGAGGENILPVRVQEALGALLGAAREGLMAVSVGVGLGVLAELMARRLDDVRLAVLMLDAIALTGRTDAGGARDHLRRGVVPLGPWEGS